MVIHSKNNWNPINIDDRHGYEEFILIADKLFHNDLPEIYFFEGRQQRHSCFRNNDVHHFAQKADMSADILSDSVNKTNMTKEDYTDTEFSEAVKSTLNSRIINGSDVNFVAIRNGKVRLRP